MKAKNKKVYVDMTEDFLNESISELESCNEYWCNKLTEIEDVDDRRFLNDKRKELYGILRHGEY